MIVLYNAFSICDHCKRPVNLLQKIKTKLHIFANNSKIKNKDLLFEIFNLYNTNIFDNLCSVRCTQIA